MKKIKRCSIVILVSIFMCFTLLTLKVLATENVRRSEAI